MFLVTANTYRGGYGLELTLFAILPTKQEAIDWILEHPVVEWIEGIDACGNECPAQFDFFEFYEKDNLVSIYEQDANGRRRSIGSRIKPKSEYAERYISEFSGSPILLDYYCE